MRPQKIKGWAFFFFVPLIVEFRGKGVAPSSSASRNRIMIRSIWCRAADARRRNHSGSCRLSHRSLKRRQRSRGDSAASGELEDATESVGREGTRRNDAAQGPARREKDRGTQGVAAHTPGPHPSCVGRRMWQSLSLITHTHTCAPMSYARTQTIRASHAHSPPMPAPMRDSTYAPHYVLRVVCPPTGRAQSCVRRRRGILCEPIKGRRGIVVRSRSELIWMARGGLVHNTRNSMLIIEINNWNDACLVFLYRDMYTGILTNRYQYFFLFNVTREMSRIFPRS